MMQHDEITEIFYNTYNNDLFYIPAKKEKIQDRPGKVKYNYKVTKQPITKAAFIDHLTTGNKVVTIGQLNKNNQCKWGAIDIDEYDSKFIETIKQKIYSHKHPLNIVQSVSGGLHLYLYSQEHISGALMRNALSYFVKELELNPKTEIFPKQPELTEETPYGNMIKLPYAAGLHSKEISTHVKKIKELAKNKIFFEDLPKITVDADNKEKKAAKETFTIKQIKQNIKNKIDHSRGGTFDNWMTDLAAKLIAARKTDREIERELKTCWLYAEKDPGGKFQNQDQDTYIENKIKNFRKKSSLEDPEILREQMIDNIIYLESPCLYFNKEKNKSYKKDAIDTVYTKIMEPKVTPIHFLRMHPGQQVVQDFKYKPGLYNPGSIIIEDEGLKYVNTYRPCSLVPKEGDISIFLDHLKYLFPIEWQREHILDWISFIFQNPGVKIRHALFIVSEAKQIGKGFLFYIWEKLLGGNNAKPIDIREALDKSKGFLNKQLVLIDELKSEDNFTENKKLTNFLKRIISEEQHGQRYLYVDFSDTAEHFTTNFILHSNELDALALDPTDPRYFVVNCDVERREEIYYDRMIETFVNHSTDAPLAAVLYYLLNRKISEKFKPKGSAPQTEAKLNMATDNEHPFIQRVIDDFKANRFPFDKDIISTGDARVHYEKIERIKIRRLNDISNALVAVGGVKIGQSEFIFNSKKTYPTLYVINNHEKYKNLTAKEVMKHYLPAYVQDPTEPGKWTNAIFSPKPFSL